MVCGAIGLSSSLPLRPLVLRLQTLLASIVHLFEALLERRVHGLVHAGEGPAARFPLHRKKHTSFTHDTLRPP